MPYMELKSTFTTCFFLFLILPCFSRVVVEGSETLHSEIYEIDYRGPETHSSVPPPHHFGGKPHSTRQKSSARAVKAMGLMGSCSTHTENKVKKVHG